MFFATYIQKLHYYIEPTTKRSEFTEKILKMIVINEKLIDYTDSSYNGFFDGKTQGRGNDKKIIGDKICNCAKKIVGSLDESEGKNKPLPKFKAYLENLQFNNATKEKLCDSFRCDLSNINVNNYIDELSELLIRIIKEAAGKENTERTVNPHIESKSDAKEVPKSTTKTLAIDNHTEDNSVNITNTSTNNIAETTVNSTINNITLFEDNRSNAIVINISEKNDSELTKLKTLINELNVGFIDLYDKGIALHSPFAHRTDEEQNEKEQKFESIRAEFIDKNKKLRYYYLSFPELRDIFEEMLSLSATLTFEVGFTDNSQNQAQYIEKYESSINELKEILFK